VARLEELFEGAVPCAKEALRFYEQNYTSIGQWVLEPGKKLVLISSQLGACRFCGFKAPKVTFKNEAARYPGINRQ
jgi:hypothetical protein